MRAGVVAGVLGLAMAVGFSPGVARAADTGSYVTYVDGQYWLYPASDFYDIEVDYDGIHGLDQQYHGFFDCYNQDYYVGGGCPIFLNGEDGYITIYSNDADPEDVYVPAAD
jgi:hypothetical protein